MTNSLPADTKDAIYTNNNADTLRHILGDALYEGGMIDNIVQRVQPFARRASVNADAVYWLEILSTCHYEACPLDLEELYTCSDQAFVRDVFGIREHLEMKAKRFLTNWRPLSAKKLCRICGEDFGQDEDAFACHLFDQHNGIGLDFETWAK